VPANPAAWIVTAARNRAIDRIRSERRWAGRRAALEAELRALGEVLGIAEEYRPPAA
jgi:RNA polymerase sigma-70 factor (ECF subfamily)